MITIDRAPLVIILVTIQRPTSSTLCVRGPGPPSVISGPGSPYMLKEEDVGATAPERHVSITFHYILAGY